MGGMHLDVYVVQHGEKGPTGGDPALSPAGVEQAQLTARHLADTGDWGPVAAFLDALRDR